MTFSELVSNVLDRLNLRSDEARDRVERGINRAYRKVTASTGLATSRRVVVETQTEEDEREVTFPNVVKVLAVWDDSHRFLDEMVPAHMLKKVAVPGQPTAYAVTRLDAHSVTVMLDTIPTANTTLHAEGYNRALELEGDDEPAFPEDFHDILIEMVMADELRKAEKPQLATMAENNAKQLLSELRYFIATSRHKTLRQNQSRRRVAGVF